MNLNLDCFRDTLKYCIDHIDYEETNHSWKVITVNLDNLYNSDELKTYLKKEIMISVVHLDECGFIKVLSKFPENKPYVDRCTIEGVTFKGHQFYENIREPSTWEKTKNIANSIGNHSLKFIEDTAQKCAVTATAAIFSNLSNPIKNP